MFDPALAALIPLGFAVGAFGTLVGAGGGFVLVPVLLLLFPTTDPETITAISLFVVAANAASGSIAYARQRRIDYRSGIWFAAATLPGAVAGAIVVGYIPRRQFDAMFAVILFAIGLYLLLRSNIRTVTAPVTGWGVVTRRVTDNNNFTFVYSFQMWKGIGISAVVGFVSSLLGIGGGVIHVPAMTQFLHFPVHIATATSQFVLGFMAAEGTAVHFYTGNLQFDESLARAGVLAIGAIGGAQLGARLAPRLQGPVIVRALSIALIIVGLRLGAKALGY